MQNESRAKKSKIFIEQKKEVRLRPGPKTNESKGKESKIVRSVSIYPSTEKKAKKLFGTLGESIEFAVKNRIAKN